MRPFPARPSPLWYDSAMPNDPQPPRPAPARTAALVSVGCKVNQGELRQWGVSLARVGVKLVAPGEPADLAIVNTCTVTGEGDKSSRQAIRQAARANPDGYLVVTGCYASVDPNAVGGIDGVDLVVANDDKDEIIRQLADVGLVPSVEIDPDDVEDAWAHRSERPWLGHPDAGAGAEGARLRQGPGRLQQPLHLLHRAGRERSAA